MSLEKKILIIVLLLLLLCWSNFYPCYQILNANLFRTIMRALDIFIDYPLVSLALILFLVYHWLKKSCGGLR